MGMKLRFFKDWYIGRFIAISPDEEYEIWHCNGFMFFEDYINPYVSRKPFTRIMTYWDRRRLWRAFKRELRIRSKELLDGKL